MTMTLVMPSIDYRESFLAALAEIDNSNHRASWLYGPFNPVEVSKNFSAYVEELCARLRNPPGDFPPGDLYWAVRDGSVVGRVALRHYLTPAQALNGGHIGYITRPSARRQGVASEMLKLLLATPKAREIGKLLLTCDVDNEASIKTIVSHGGVFDGVREFTEEGVLKRKRHYWIDLSNAAANGSGNGETGESR